MIEKGKADAMFPLFKTADRAVYTDYSDPFTSEDTALFVLKNASVQWKGNLKDLTAYKFGRVRGYSSGPGLDYLISTGMIKLEEAGKTSQNIQKLLGKRYEIMIENRYVARYELKKLNQSDNTRMLSIVQENLAHLGFSKKRKHTAIIKKFNAILNRMKKDGSYRKIIDNFFITEQINNK